MNAIQKKFKQLSKQDFDVGARQHELGLLEDMLTSPDKGKSILLVHGLGAVGKTALMARFWRLCRQRKIPVGVVDGGEARSVLNVLGTLGQQFPSNRHIKRLSQGLKRTHRIHKKLEKKSGRSAISIVLSAGVSKPAKKVTGMGARKALWTSGSETSSWCD